MKKILVVLFTILLMSAMTICVFATDGETEEFDFSQWFTNTFTVERVVAFASSFVAACLTIIVAKIKQALLKEKEINTLEINKIVDKAVREKTEEYLPQVMTPVINRIDALVDGNKSILKGFVLCQDNSLNSKLAMYDLIGQTKIVDKSTIDMCKQDVEKEIQKTEEQKQENIKELDNIIIPQGDL